MGIPHPGGPSPTGSPLVSLGPFQAEDGQVSVVQVLLAWDLGMLWDLGVASSPQSCPLCQMSCMGGQEEGRLLGVWPL